MKKDKYEIYKPEAFKYEEDFTPSLLIASIAAIVFMAGILILFILCVIGFMSSIPAFIK